MDELNDRWDVEMNFSSSGAHAPEIKEVNRVLQERFRVALYLLPFKLIPRTTINFLDHCVTRHIHYFPVVTEISKHDSPYTIVSGW